MSFANDAVLLTGGSSSTNSALAYTFPASRAGIACVRSATGVTALTTSINRV